VHFVCFRKNFAPTIAKTTIFDKSREGGAQVRDIVTLTFRGVAAASGTVTMDLTSVAGASPRNFRLAGSTV
jgi:hypothetical protein